MRKGGLSMISRSMRERKEDRNKARKGTKEERRNGEGKEGKWRSEGGKVGREERRK